MALLEQARPSPLELWPTELTPALSESLGRSWSKNMWEKEPEWLEKFSRWPEQKKPVLSFSTKSMQ